MLVKSYGSTIELLTKLLGLSVREGRRIPGVGVESVDIRRKTKSVSICLAEY